MSTDNFLKAYFAASDAQRNAAWNALTGRDGGNAATADRAVTRKEAARILGCDPHTVTAYAKRGLIRRLTLGSSGVRASRYSMASVMQLLEGKGAAKGAEVAR